jgi:hypothetical protein
VVAIGATVALNLAAIAAAFPVKLKQVFQFSLSLCESA